MLRFIRNTVSLVRMLTTLDLISTPESVKKRSVSDDLAKIKSHNLTMETVRGGSNNRHKRNRIRGGGSNTRHKRNRIRGVIIIIRTVFTYLRSIRETSCLPGD